MKNREFEKFTGQILNDEEMSYVTGGDGPLLGIRSVRSTSTGAETTSATSSTAWDGSSPSGGVPTGVNSTESSGG